jgi:hypothetical protein
VAQAIALYEGDSSIHGGSMKEMISHIYLQGLKNETHVQFNGSVDSSPRGKPANENQTIENFNK